MVDILTPKQVAAKLQTSTRKVYELLNNGDLKGFRLGKKFNNNGGIDKRPWRIVKTDLDNYISGQ